MHVVFRLTLSALVVASVACTDVADDLDVDEAATAKADGFTTWLKVHDCDGAAVLDVDSGERRNLQFVIRDPDIVEYLRTATMLEFTDFVNAAGEIILSASVDRGVFAPGDFSSMSPAMISAYNDYLHVMPRVFRDFTGLKVEFRIEQADVFQGECDGGGTECTPVHWNYGGTFNWYFPNCH